MDIPNDASWTMRMLLNLRSVAQPLIQYLIGNGQGTFLWLENWHPLGPLFNKFGENIVYNLGRSLNSKVSSIIHDGVWRWPRQRNRATQFIIEHTPADFKPICDRLDSVVWIPHLAGFTVSSAWEAIRLKFPIQPWSSIVWYSKNVPHWAFILWLVVLHRLSTKDRLLSWGMNVEDGCVLCNNGQESHEHLFFHCVFSQSVWGAIWQRCSMAQIRSSLSDMITWYIQNAKGSSFKCWLLKSVLAACVYNLWIERNLRIFQHKFSPIDQVILKTVTSIRELVHSKTGVKQSQKNMELCCNWGLSNRIFTPSVLYRQNL
ncbi:uncharacterized protein LOC131327608 [Rhododendron vialii]|uniref:uncharacterized protein LOC131327608 n=1 Tax=Rhododendron vialii TaxID=182163 RepID=UPI00265E22A8|nr:uncharacterized protein LOC131327608 [Rhododendron vialii]